MQNYAFVQESTNELWGSQGVLGDVNEGCDESHEFGMTMIRKKAFRVIVPGKNSRSAKAGRKSRSAAFVIYFGHCQLNGIEHHIHAAHEPEAAVRLDARRLRQIKGGFHEHVAEEHGCFQRGRQW